MSYHELTQHGRLVLAGMLAFVIAYQLWIARVRRREPILYLVVGWAGAALLMVVGRFVQHATIEPATVLLGSRIYHTGVLALVPLGFALAHEVRAVPRGRLFRLCVAASSVPIPLVWIGDLVISDQVRAIETLAGPILGPEPAALGPMVIPYIGVVAAYLIYVARRGRRRVPWHQRLSLGVALFVLLPALVNDVLLYAGAIRSVEVVGVALFAHIGAINLGLLGRAGELFAGLERTVEERTAALRAREQRLARLLGVQRRLLDAVPEVVCLLRDGHFDYVNDAGEQFFGRSRAELTGMPFTGYVAAGQVPVARECLARIESSPRPVPPVDLRFAPAEGPERPAEVAGVALELDDGPRTLVTVRDLTERHVLMARLQVADRLASVGTLAAGVAHEINNPLTFIGGNLELIQAALARDPRLGGADGAELRQSVDDCATGTERIAQIVKDLTTFTRAEDARVAVDCRAVLEYALKIATVTIRHRADVTVDYGPTPPVMGDSRRLSQVFLNLLVNALQSLPDDARPHAIRVSTRTRADGWAVVEVADTGVGIDPAMHEAVFDPFVSTKPAGQGTGLGLFICHRIVSDLGGQIELLPGSPVGTVARVVLPPAPPAPAPLAAAAAPSAAARPGAGVRVLVADDEELVLRMLRQVLEGYDVTAVSSGDAAIRALEQERYDVILCDLVMPGSSGADVWRRARELGLADRFVLMTGGATTPALRDFIERSAVPCLAKPTSAAVLRKVIGDRLAGRGAAGGPSPPLDPSTLDASAR